MKHIIPDRCGYDGFVCKGITKLNTYFDKTLIDVFATDDPTNRDLWVWSPTGSTVSQETIDNYAQIPQNFEGFVMTLNPVIDMSGGSDIVEVPELSCRTNMDPFVSGVLSVQNSGAEYTVEPNTANSGLVDLYNQVPQYFNDVYDTVDNNGHYHLRYTIKPAYNFTVGPGLLEPMLDTMFPPVGVDTITSPDTLGDFTVWLFDEFNTWKGLVDDRLRNLYQIVPSYDYSKINGLLNLEDAKNHAGPCDNFQIQLSYNTPVIGTSLTAYPVYEITGGVLRIGEETFEVEGTTMSGAIFDSYLEVYIDGGTYAGRVLETPPGLLPDDINGYPHEGHVTYEYIGAVRRVISAANYPERDAAQFTEYVIHQDNCLYEITLSGGTGTTLVSDYKGPFKLRVSGPTVYLAEGDELPDDATVVGGPTASVTGETATHDYEAYTVDIVDGAGSVPSYGSTNYAGYVIPDGITYDKIVTHSFRVDTSTTAASYLLLTKTLFGWDDEYVDYAGMDVPNTARTRIPGTTINLAGTTVGQIIDGYTVTAIAGGTVSYTDGTNTETAEPDEQYLVQLGIVSGGTVGQVQYGDIFIDKQDIPEPQPDVGSTYSGPFTVTVTDGTATIKCDDCQEYDDEEEITGYYSINGGGYTAMHVLEGVAAAAGDYVYLQFSTNDPVLSTAESASPGVYNVLLARVTGATSAAQLHYGNIHVDGRWS